MLCTMQRERYIRTFLSCPPVQQADQVGRIEGWPSTDCETRSGGKRAREEERERDGRRWGRRDDKPGRRSEDSRRSPSVSKTPQYFGICNNDSQHSNHAVCIATIT